MRAIRINRLIDSSYEKVKVIYYAGVLCYLDYTLFLYVTLIKPLSNTTFSSMTVYHSRKYKKMTKRNNGVALLKDGRYIQITVMIEVLRQDTQDIEVIVLATQYDKIQNYRPLLPPAFGCENIRAIVRKTSIICAFTTENLDKKCVLIPMLDDKMAIYPLTNRNEKD